MSKPSREEFCNAAKNLFLPTIFRYVNRNREAAADIFQQTMVSILVKYDELKDPEAYGWKIIHNLKLIQYTENTHNRKHNSLSDLEYERFEVPTDGLDDPEAVLSYKQYAEYLDSAIKLLPDQKQVMVVDYLTKGRKFDRRTKKYVGMTIADYSKKYDVSETVLYDLIAELKKSIIRMMSY